MCARAVCSPSPKGTAVPYDLELAATGGNACSLEVVEAQLVVASGETNALGDGSVVVCIHFHHVAGVADDAIDVAVTDLNHVGVCVPAGDVGELTPTSIGQCVVGFKVPVYQEVCIGGEGEDGGGEGGNQDGFIHASDVLRCTSCALESHHRKPSISAPTSQQDKPNGLQLTQRMLKEIGRVIGTEKRPNTAYTFSFWAPVDAPIGIGTVVRVDSGTTRVWGTVVEAHGFNDLQSPLHEFLSVGGNAEVEPPTLRPEMRVFLAAVLRREPDEPISAVPIGTVFLADEQDLRKALRTDAYAQRFGLPAGCYGPRSTPMPVHLHRDFLLGPEAGHLNMTGTSGLAAKTSYILYLLTSIFQVAEREETRIDRGVAAILFNAKGGDLLYIDHPTNEPLSGDDLEMYLASGLEAKPFPKVSYYAPYDVSGGNLRTLRDHEELQPPTRPFSFGLREVIQHAEVLLNRDDLDAKADAYLQYLNQRFVEGSHRIGGKEGELRHADSLGQLVDIIAEQLEWAEANNGSIETHHAHTVRKMLNRIGNLGRRYGGLIAEQGAAEGPLGETFEPGRVYVVDVSQLDSEAQDLVFAAFITKLRERMENQDLGVGRLIVVVDELNKYASTSGGDSYVAKSLREIAARGRYLGLTLFGAQQFRSRVDKEIVGNSATHAFGHIESEELAQPGYGHFSPAIKEKLATLSPGEVLIKHPHFAQPVFVRFPRPASMKGSEGMRLYPRRQRRAIDEMIRDELRRMAIANPTRMNDALMSISPDPKTKEDLLRRLRRLEDRADPLATVEATKKSAAFSAKQQRSVRKAVADDDPFA